VSKQGYVESVITHLREAQVLSKLVGQAGVFLQAIANVAPVAKGDATVLIGGETGTGKEMVARAIHYLSERAAYPFVAVNCGSLPDTLLETELFGHQRGAFTDAHADRHGLVAQAEKGTLFLDEVDALSPRAQVALLRLLQDRSFRALGSSREQYADVRVIAATNTELGELVETARFRSDLYYRLCVFTINLPPLRARGGDILLLAAHFLDKHAPSDKRGLELSSQARETLLAWPWPGNVRELENAIIRGVYFSRGGSIRAEDLDLSPARKPPAGALDASPLLRSFKDMKHEIVEAFERDYLTRLMQQHCGNVSHAARAAGKERRDLGKLLKKYRLDPRLFQSGRAAAAGLGENLPAWVETDPPARVG
jgi:transcriptional regulator with GAF, ATPase, and Fis domain